LSDFVNIAAVDFVQKNLPSPQRAQRPPG
jgi:hypothetical protein